MNQIEIENYLTIAFSQIHTKIAVELKNEVPSELLEVFGQSSRKVAESLTTCILDDVKSGDIINEYVLEQFILQHHIQIAKAAVCTVPDLKFELEKLNRQYSYLENDVNIMSQTIH